MKPENYLQLLKLEGVEVENLEKKYWFYEELEMLLNGIKNNLSVNRITRHITKDNQIVCTIVEQEKCKNYWKKKDVAEVIAEYSDYDKNAYIKKINIISSSMWKCSSDDTDCGHIDWIEIDGKILFEGLIFNNVEVTFFIDTVNHDGAVYPVVKFMGEKSRTVRI